MIAVAVNVSPLQFKSENLPRIVFRALAASALRAGRLELEFTESLFLDKTDIVMARLHELHAMGVKIALDDFGVVYSSLGHLRHFPVDKVKIDKCFVDELRSDPKAAAMIRAIVDLSAALGMSTTAEGVESLGQVEALCAQSFTDLQGYFFSRLQPIGAVMEMVEYIDTAARCAA